jgi:TonB-dependent receptor
MELREAPSELHLDMLWQSGYTAKSKEYGNYRGVASVSRRFFDDMLGVYLLGNIESYDRNADNMTASYFPRNTDINPTTGFRPIQVADVQQVRHIETRQRYGGNLILDYKLPSGLIKSINMFTRLNSDYKDYRQVLDYGNQGNINFRYRAGENNIDQALNSLEIEYDFDFLQADLKFANTYSFNSLPYSPYVTFLQNGGIDIVTQSLENRIPEDLVELQHYETLGGGINETFLQDLNLFSSNYKENNQNYKATFKIPFTIGSDISAYFKAGGEYTYQNHSNDQETPYITLNGNTDNDIVRLVMDSLQARFNLYWPGNSGPFPALNFSADPTSDLYDAFLDDSFGKMYWMINPSLLTEMINFIANTPEFAGVNNGAQNVGGWFHGPYQSLTNDYKYNEKYYAGYAMTEINFLDFMLVGGVRYEKVNSEYEVFNMVNSTNPNAQIVDSVTSDRGNEFWLPMVQVRYKPFDWMDVRYAYTQTLARVDYHQLSPRISMNYQRLQVWAGNPDLVPAEAFNHDLILSFHNNELGLLTIGGFYKTISNFSYYTAFNLHQTAPAGVKTIYDYAINSNIPAENARVYTYVNSQYDAIVKGIEIDFQTRLWYLPFPLNGLVLGLNYTHIKSEATYPFRNNRSYANPNFGQPGEPRFITMVFDSTRSGRLLYQPDNILNSYIGFDYEGFSTRVSVVYQENAVSYVGQFPEDDGFTRDYFRVDASARQILPWAGIEIYLDLFNLNSKRNSSAQKSIGGLTNEQNYGLTANLGVRYRL